MLRLYAVVTYKTMIWVIKFNNFTYGASDSQDLKEIGVFKPLP